jgi:hypothetical protein
VENEIINTKVIQFHPSSLYSVFVFENVFDKNYLNTLHKKVDSLTKDNVSMTRMSNVKATMTDWEECLKYKTFTKLNTKIIELLNTVIRLRTSHETIDLSYKIIEMWGMRHKKGDYTNLHDHWVGDVKWSGAFYVSVPGETIIEFPEFKKREQIKSNSLYLFPGMVKHEVYEQKYDEHRLSLAFNINVN